MEKYKPNKVNEILDIKPNQLFIADIIGAGIYKMIEHGINHSGRTYAIAECRKLFMRGFESIGHQTTCHPINIEKWNSLKVLTPNSK